MTTQEVADKLVELCKDSKNFDAMEQLYAGDIVSVEGMARKDGRFETAGKAAVIQKSKDWAAAHEIHGGEVDGPFVASEKFAVFFDFDVTEKASGKRHNLREIAVYTVAGGEIVKEEFLYAAGADGLKR